jgi:hypothetical protein
MVASERIFPLVARFLLQKENIPFFHLLST